MVRGLGVAVLMVLLCAAPAMAEEATLDWSVVDRLAGPASVDESAPARAAALRVAVDAAGTCPNDPNFKLDGATIAARPAPGCAFDLAPIQPGRHTLALEGADGGRVAQTDVDLRDLLVVSLGDSVASGEGNPDGPGIRWLERRCHRSLRSGAAQAASAVERGDRHSVVTFVPLACSGATVDTGLLGAYDGVEPNRRRGPLPPQLDVLERLRRPVDAVLLSVGANDVRFSALTRFCMVVRNCPERRFDPAHPLREADASHPTAAAFARQALERLQAGYDRLAARLARTVDPSRTIVVQYFDPLRDADGAICARALPGLDRAEAQWAERSVLAPLNVALQAAAVRHGWQVVGGVADAFRRHGICAGRAAWVADPLHSLAAELAIVGTLHPNGPGHTATATLIAPVLAATLGLAPNLVPDEPSSSGRVPWPWLLVAAAAGALAALLIRRMVQRR
ncbi:MAG TPA: GDSL-type esterase/lipase family protein [Conexibacter sp.]|nr:GDSL-type esterase/lipase family protein [Conexibacter sp.]